MPCYAQLGAAFAAQLPFAPCCLRDAQTFDDGTIVPCRSGREAGMKAQEVHPAVLRSLQQVLPHLPPVRAARLLQGMHHLFKRTRTGGASQAACLQLWLHLLQQAPGALPEEATLSLLKVV